MPDELAADEDESTLLSVLRALLSLPERSFHTIMYIMINIVVGKMSENLAIILFGPYLPALPIKSNRFLQTQAEPQYMLYSIGTVSVIRCITKIERGEGGVSSG